MLLNFHILVCFGMVFIHIVAVMRMVMMRLLIVAVRIGVAVAAVIMVTVAVTAVAMVMRMLSVQFAQLRIDGERLSVEQGLNVSIGPVCHHLHKLRM